MYNFEVEKVVQEILNRKAKRVLLQFPEGLKSHALEVTRAIGKNVDVEIMVSGDPCYGGCDLPLGQAGTLGVDLIIHYGHSQMPSLAALGVLYIEAQADIDIEDTVSKALSLLEGKTYIGLASTVQHVSQLPIAEKLLVRSGKKVLIGQPGNRTIHAGQVLGCDYSSAFSVEKEVEAFLFIGGGLFHPLGLSLATGKEVVTADPYTGRVSKITERDRMQVMKKRWAAISAAQRAKRFGIILGLKLGQRKLAAASALRRKLEERGKETVLICMEEINFENLSNFSEIEAFVDTACPRIAIDGIYHLPQVLITGEEALVMLGDMDWSSVWRETFASDEGTTG